MPSLDGHTLIRRGDGLGDLDIAIGSHEVHILGGTDLALDGNRILRIEGNLSLGGGDVALGSDVTPGLDGQVALGADIAVLDNLHILAGNKLATSVVSRNRALDNQVALGGGDCNSIGADSAVDEGVVLRFYNRNAGFEGAVDRRIPASTEFECVSGGDGFVGNDVTLLGFHGDHRRAGFSIEGGVVLCHDIHDTKPIRCELGKLGITTGLDLHVSYRGCDVGGGLDIAGRRLDGNIGAFNSAIDNHIALGGGDFDAIRADSAIECRVVLRGDGHVASMGSELRESCVTARSGGDVAVVRDDVGSGGDVTARGDGCILLRGDHSGNLRILAGFDGCVTGSDGASHNDISPVSGEGEVGASLDAPVECRIVLCGDGHVASMGSELRESCVTASINDDIVGIRGDVSRGVDIPSAPDVDQGLGRDELLVNPHIPTGED